RTGDELSAIYRSADVFVFPSRTDTFGNVMIEAMASGLPVAAYPVTGPRDILTAACGAMDEDLALAVRQALTLDPAAARAHALGFTWSACAEIFLDTLVPVHRKLAAAA
ncbi:MAG: glycosyltransferase, partial [Sphingomonadales bacterium]